MRQWQKAGVLAVAAAAVVLPMQQARSVEDAAQKQLELKLDKVLANQQALLTAVKSIQGELPEIKEELRIIKIRSTHRRG